MQVIPPKNAILQKDKETYAIVPRIPGGLIRRDQLVAITAAVKKYDIPAVKITSGQRIALIGLKEEYLEDIYKALKMDPGKATELCLHYVQACPGTEFCRFGVRDSLGFGIKLENLLADLNLPAKLKLGVSGCQFCCAESFVRDIGLVGKKNGWTLSFGGHSGNRARVGDIIAKNISEEEAIELTTKSLAFYIKNGRKKERTSRFIDRIGVEEFKQSIGLS